MTKSCWCGNQNLEKWNDAYARCSQCRTLVDQSETSEKIYAPQDNRAGLYDSAYWLDARMREYRGLGCEDFDDVVLLHYRERAAYWLCHFIHYCLPPAKVWEIGCGMGTFSHWLTQLGYDVDATELSPEWVKIVREKLGIAVTASSGASPRQEGEGYDAMVMMDVLEHQQNPRQFLDSLAPALRDTGILFLQLPCYDGISGFADAVAKNAPFLAGVKPVEHPFVYSRESLARLLAEAGFTAIQQYAPIFVYDMFLLAGRTPLKTFTDLEIKRALMKPSAIAAFAALKNYQAYVSLREGLRARGILA